MLLLVISADTPLKRIKTAYKLLKKAVNVLFFGNSVAVVCYDDESEKRDLKTIATIITSPLKR
ncbi:hypothetical protein Q4R59_08395 [Morganella morganii]